MRARFQLRVILSAAKNLPVWLIAILSPSQNLYSQLPGQSFTVVPGSGAVTVGDSVTVRFRIRLHERDQPLDSIPQVIGVLPNGVRVLSVDKLSRTADRVYHGSARLAFYRPGRRPVPIFGLPFMRVVEGVSRAILPSDSAFVEITPVLAPGNPPLKDIKELEPRPASPWAALVVGLSLIVAVILSRVLPRRPKDSVVVAEPEAGSEPSLPSPYEIALQRLDELEREHWPARGNVARHYESAAQALREYLEHAHSVGALERTTPELLWALPPHLSRGGLRDRCHDVLGEADLVKFAKVRPSELQAADFLGRARQLLAAWHQTGLVEESVNALR